ncbi:MAG: hypothetical protein Q7L55_08675 [Actinomycetota bacterium]|nr:hypothetical protein [Actinomycetota bacterium]
MICGEVQEEIAVALLTRAALGSVAAAHVLTCPACAAEQASLRGVSSIMAAVSTADVVSEDVPVPNDMHLERILRAVAAERVQRRRRTLMRTLAGAAAVVVVAVGIGVGFSAVAPDNHSITAIASASGLSVSADIVSDGDGSQLTIAVSGVPQGTKCVLSVHTVDGGTEQVLAWTAKYDGKAYVVASSRATPDAIASVTLTGADGSILLDVPVV